MKNKHSRLALTLIIAGALVAVINYSGCAAKVGESLAAAPAGAQCTMPPKAIGGYPLFMAQGNPYGKMCAAFGPTPDSQCYGVLCRAECGGEWEYAGEHCPKAN